MGPARRVGGIQTWGPALTLLEVDRERRICLARLTARQAQKYRTTLNLLELADSDLRTASLVNRLGITRATLRRYRKEAPNTLEKVESKIDAWADRFHAPSSTSALKTLVLGARPASASIVAPYRETVLRLASQGEGHRFAYDNRLRKNLETKEHKKGYPYSLSDLSVVGVPN